MPIARAKLADGSVLRYYVPEGTTSEERSQIYAPVALRKRAAGIDPLEPPKTTLGGYAKEIGKGLASGAAGLVESAATGASFLLPEEQEQAARKAIAEYGAGVQEGLLPKGGYEDTVVRKLAEATGSTVPFLATGAFGGLGGLASRVALGTGVGLGAAAGSGEAAKRAEAAGATEEQISKAAGLGILPGLGETLVPFAVGKTIRAGVKARRGLDAALGKAPAGDVVSRLRRIGSAAGGEGLQEASAEIAQNLISQGVYDPETGTFAGTGESLGYGAGVGGLLAALAEIAIPGPSRARVSTPTTETTTEETTEATTEETTEATTTPPVTPTTDPDSATPTPPATEDPELTAAEEAALVAQFDRDQEAAAAQEAAAQEDAEGQPSSEEFLQAIKTVEAQEAAAQANLTAVDDTAVDDTVVADTAVDDTVVADTVVDDTAVADTVVSDETDLTLDPDEIQNTLENAGYTYMPEFQTVAQAKAYAKKEGLSGAGVLVREDSGVTAIFPSYSKTAIGSRVGSGMQYGQKKFKDGTKASEVVAWLGNDSEAADLRGEEQPNIVADDIDVVNAEQEQEQDQQPPPVDRTADDLLVYNEAAAKPQGPIGKYFAAQNNFQSGIDALAQDLVVFGTKKIPKAATNARTWIKKNLSSAATADLRSAVATLKETLGSMDGLPLPAAEIAITSQPLSQQIRDKLVAGDLRGAINDLRQSSDATIARVATAIEKGLGNTKVVMGQGLVNPKGEPVAGLYDPKTDTITLNQDVPLRNHVLLHESIHAVTSHEVAGNSAAAQQMRNLFESVRDRLDTAYGATNLDEFIAEVFSNPEFQAKLARINTEGGKINAWTKFKNIVNNMIRKFRGQPSKKIESVMDKADSLIAELVSPAPESRDAATLFSATVEGKEKETLNSLGRFSKGKLTKEDIAVAGQWFTTANRKSQGLINSILPLNAVYQLSKAEYPLIAKVGEDLFKLLQTKNGSRQKYLNKIKDTAKAVEDVIDGDAQVKEVLDKWATFSSINRTDPTELRTQYLGDDAKQEAYAEMEDMASGLSAAQKKKLVKSYSMLRDSYKKVYEELVAVMETRLNAIEDSTVKKDLKDRLLKDLLEKESISPYFPLHRKGQYWLFYQTNNGTRYREAFESEFKRDEAGRQLRLNKEQLGINEDSIETHTRGKGSGLGQVDSRFALGLLTDLQAKGISEDARKVILDALFDIMPERSLVSAFRPRQEIEGFETDSLKVFRERMPNFTNQIVNLENDLALSKVSQDLEIATLSYQTGDQARYNGAETLRNNLQGYIDFARNPKIATYSKVLKTAGFGMTLGFNFSSVLVNASNIPIVVLPYLGGRYGFRETSKALSNATKLFASTGMNRRTETINEQDGGTEVFEGPSMSNIDFTDSNLDPEQKELEMLHKVMLERGQINISTTAENLDMENPANTAWAKFNAYMGWMFHQGERANRQITAIAAYKLELAERAKNKEITDKDRREAAEKALEDVELTNSGAMIETAPRVSQSDMGNWMTMYKRFGISMYYLQARMASQALRNALPNELKTIANEKYEGDVNKLTDEDRQTAEDKAKALRTQAKKQLVGLFASSALFAGVQGLPLYGAVSFIANHVLLDDEDEDFDSIAASYFGEGMYSGVLNAAFKVDVAPRIGMSNLIYRSLPNREQEALSIQLLEFLGGPVVGIASRVEDGASLVAEGEVYRGFEKMLPSFLSNGMKALRYGTEGATTLRGDPILEDVHPGNVFAQLLGLAPAGYTKQLEINARDKGLERRLNSKRSDLMREYYLALKEGDIDGMLDLSEEMAEFSERNPYVAISGDTIRRSINQHRTTDEIARQLGGISTSARQAQRILQRRAEDLDLA